MTTRTCFALGQTVKALEKIEYRRTLTSKPYLTVGVGYSGTIVSVVSKEADGTYNVQWDGVLVAVEASGAQLEAA